MLCVGKSRRPETVFSRAATSLYPSPCPPAHPTPTQTLLQGEGVPPAPPVHPLGHRQGPPGLSHPVQAWLPLQTWSLRPWPGRPGLQPADGRDVWPWLSAKAQRCRDLQVASPAQLPTTHLQPPSSSHPYPAGFIAFIHLSQASRGQSPDQPAACLSITPAWGGRPQGHANSPRDGQQGHS